MSDRTDTLRNSVAQTVDTYLTQFKDDDPINVYDLVLKEIEEPLLRTVLDQCRGNQSKAAEYLGLSRGTLRKKLKHFDLI